MRARSRLQPSFDPPVATFQRQPPELPKWTEAYIGHLPTLFVSGALYVAVLFFVTKVRPESVQNVLFPSSYFPFHVLLFLANFFLFSFIFLNTRRGYLVAFMIMMWMFARLQNFTFSLPILTVFIILFVIIETSGSILEKVSGSDAGFHKKSYTGRRRRSSKPVL